MNSAFRLIIRRNFTPIIHPKQLSLTLLNKMPAMDPKTSDLPARLRAAMSPLSVERSVDSRVALDAMFEMYKNKTGDKIKTSEKACELMTVPPNKTFVMRLDGVSFHVFTRGIRKPFDERLRMSLVRTTEDLVTKFQASLGYAQSDEISLVFPRAMNDQEWNAWQEWEAWEASRATRMDLDDHRPRKRPVNRTHSYNGRVAKLLTVVSSYASARFNYYMANDDWSDLAPAVIEKVTSHTAMFDNRLIICDQMEQAMECIFWRSNLDGLRNAINAVAQSLFKAKELQKKSIVEVSELLKNNFSIEVFRDIPQEYLFGTFIKKEIYELQNVKDWKTGEILTTPVQRSRLRKGSFNWAEWSPENRTLFTASKHWTDGGPESPPKTPL